MSFSASSAASISAWQGKKGINGGKNGDLLIKIDIENDDKFKLFGNDLCTELKISPWEAVLGTKINLKTIDEILEVCVPEGIQSGEKIRVQGKGYKDGKGGRGDLIAVIQIIVPKVLNEEEIGLYKKLEQISNFNPR